MVAVSGILGNVCVVPLVTPLAHSGETDTENELTPWLLTVVGMVQFTRMLVALRERALVAMVSAMSRAKIVSKEDT